MTKTIKLSLVAAVAVAGFTTSAAAADLSNTTFSGKMEVEYDYTKNDITEDTTNRYDLDLDVTATTKLSDTWTAIAGIQADVTEDNQDGGSLNNGNVNVSKTYFQYANGTSTAKIGRQGVGTPFFDDERADGVVALTTVGGITFAAAHFNNLSYDLHANINAMNLDIPATQAPIDALSAALSDEAVNAAAVIGSFSGINASLWFADVSNTLDAWTLNLNGKFDIVSVDLTHTELDFDDDDTDNSLTKLIVSAPVGPVTLTAGYAMTDEEGGLVAFNDDASTAFTLDKLSMNGLPDADAGLIAISGTFGSVTASLTHLNGDADDVDFDETQIKTSYQLAKALKATASYSDYEIEDVQEGAIASIALEYKF